VPLLGPEVLAHGWLTKGQFLDGIALGQATPGPIVTASAFVGYRVAGVTGALVATAAIYLPAFLVVLLASGPFVRSIHRRPGIRAAAAGFNAAAVGAIAASAVGLGRVGLASPLRVAVALAAGLALWRKVPVWAVLLGALAVGAIAAAAS
jgi:chromate transporter